MAPGRASAPGIPCEIRFALSRPLRFAKGTFAPARTWAGLKSAPTGGVCPLFPLDIFPASGETLGRARSYPAIPLTLTLSHGGERVL